MITLPLSVLIVGMVGCTFFGALCAAVGIWWGLATGRRTVRPLRETWPFNRHDTQA